MSYTPSLTDTQLRATPVPVVETTLGAERSDLLLAINFAILGTLGAILAASEGRKVAYEISDLLSRFNDPDILNAY